MPKNDLFDFSQELDVAVGPSGLAADLLKEILSAKVALIAKLASGKCKSMESYADAVGCLRAYDFVLGYAERKKQAIESSLGTPIEEEDSP